MKMDNSKTEYRGYTIQEDRKLGWSLFSPKGVWCLASISVDKLKKAVDYLLSKNKKYEN